MNTNDLQTAVLKCACCGYESECLVDADAELGDVVRTAKCEQCNFKDADAGREAVVVEVGR
jgi:hypothetical protein